MPLCVCTCSTTLLSLSSVLHVQVHVHITHTLRVVVPLSLLHMYMYVDVHIHICTCGTIKSSIGNSIELSSTCPTIISMYCMCIYMYVLWSVIPACPFLLSLLSFLSGLESTQWLHYLCQLLSVACEVVGVVNDQAQPILIHCSDGWDRTTQVVALAELMLDPFYRTIKVRVVCV